MKRRTLARFICISLSIVLLFTLMVHADEDTQTVDYGAKLDQVVEILKQNHINSSPEDDPIRHALVHLFETVPGYFDAFVDEMYQSYDRYSHYMSSETYGNAYPTSNKMVGIGVTVEEREDGCYITDLNQTGTAIEVGMLEGDKIIAVDGKSVEGYSPSMISDLMSGAEGTTVEVVVLREGKELTFQPTRKEVTLSNVHFENKGDGVAYFKIDKLMGSDTFMDFIVYYEQLKEKGFKSIILDLRDNPGGDISCLVNMMDHLIYDKDMPYLMLRQGNPMGLKTYASEGYGWEFNRMVILVNENTASSAEVMAGALQDLGYAVCVGTTTYGKGMAQAHTQLEDGSYAIYSTQELLLPITGKYDMVGIKPKYYVEMSTQPREKINLAPLNRERGVYQTTQTNVLGIEQRLRQLGYFEDQADSTPDFKTFHAINQFQKENGIPVTEGYCDASTVRAIDDAMTKLQNTPVVRDTQLEKALYLAREGAKGNTKPTIVPKESIRFVGQSQGTESGQS